MLEREDVQAFTANKQELQVVAELLFSEMMEDGFDLAAFLADPRGYTRAFLEESSGRILAAILPDAYRLGEGLATKAGGGSGE